MQYSLGNNVKLRDKEVYWRKYGQRDKRGCIHEIDKGLHKENLKTIGVTVLRREAAYNYQYLTKHYTYILYMQSSSNELSTLVSGKAKCKQVKVDT